MIILNGVVLLMPRTMKEQKVTTTMHKIFIWSRCRIWSCCLCCSWRICCVHQCRSKGNISGGGGARKCWTHEPLGGCGGMLPQKNLKSRDLEMLFPVFSKSYLQFTHIANYLLRTLS